MRIKKRKLIRLVINIVDIIEEALRLNGIVEREKEERFRW